MYFHNRAQAGRELAKKLLQYKSENCAVLALSPGGVIVGAQIAMRLHASLMFLVTDSEGMSLEADPMTALGSVGAFSYNTMYTPGQLEETMGEHHRFYKENHNDAFRNLNTMVGIEGEVKKEGLRRHVVIVVSDGFFSGFSLEVAEDYLHPVGVKKLIVATPVASVTAVDRMHSLGDQIECLSVVENYVSTEHHYDENTIPGSGDLLKLMRNISINWDRKTT